MTTIQDLNSLGLDNPIVVALDIYIPNTPTVYVVRNGENIVFNGNTYIAFEFNIQEITAQKGETPSSTLQIDNSTRIMERYLIDYDLYLKKNGIDGNEIRCTIHAINTNNMTSIFTAYFELLNWQTDNKYATFNLGASSPINKQFPPRKLIQNFCFWKFKSSQCGYRGSSLTCDKTLTACRSYNNSSRFGGFIGMGQGIRL